MIAPRPSPNRPIRLRLAPVSTIARRTPGWLRAGGAMPWRRVMQPAKKDRNAATSPGDQRHSANDRGFGRQDPEPAWRGGECGADGPGGVLAGYGQYADCSDEQHADEHADQRVAGEHAAACRAAAAYCEGDARGRGDGNGQGEPGGAQAAQ